MAFCQHCGNQVADGSAFCDNCGAQQTQQQAYQQSYQPLYQTQQSYYQSQQPVSKTNSVLALVFGLIAIFSALFCIYPFANFVFLPVAIVFLCLSKGQRNRFVGLNGSDNGMSRTGGILSTIAIPLSIVCFVLSLFYFMYELM